MIDTLCIIGVGLIGGSLARALRDAGLVRRVVGCGRDPGNLARAIELGVIDHAESDPAKAVAGADMVVVAVTLGATQDILSRIAPALDPAAVVTDVGSVKAEISRLGAIALGERGQFVGSHPMAGSEKTGWEHGTAELFERRTCFVTPLPTTSPAATERVVRFWHDLGGEAVTVDPDRHDEIVAHISHLPQVLASTLCAFLASRDSSWRNYAGGGLRDTTRIAGSDPQLWRTILEQNRDEVLRALCAYEDELHSFRSALSNRDYPAVIAHLERGQSYRRQFRPAP